jgi:hypothetical protein
MKRVLLLLSVLVFYVSTVDGRATDADSVNRLTHSLYTNIADSIKFNINSQLYFVLESDLKSKTPVYTTGKLNRIAKVESEDGKVVILTWNTMLSNKRSVVSGVYRYIKDDGDTIVNRLIQGSYFGRRLIRQTLRANNWFGALYYSIIGKKIGKRIYYTLLGVNPRGISTNLKVIDVAFFDNRRGLVFGAPVFVNKKKKAYRVLFEYSEKVSFMLKYEKREDRIIFDHLASESEYKNGAAEFMIPDMTYDAFRFKRSGWNFKSNVDLRNSKAHKRQSRKRTRSRKG